MIALSVVYDVKPGHMQAVLAALARMRSAIADHEPGCKLFQVSRVRGEDNRLILYEVYADEQALEAHSTSAHFDSIIKGEVVPMLDQRVRTTLDIVIE